jgi:integrase/recombinase XerD
MDMPDALNLVRYFDPTAGDEQLRNRVIIELLLGCGLRIGEVVGIRQEHLVDIRSMGQLKIHIPETKNKREHMVEVPPSTVPLIRELQKRNLAASNSEMLFVKKSAHTEKMTYEMFRKCFKKALKALGLDPKTRVHALRATFVTYLRSRGVSREGVQELINQSSPASIIPYDGYIDQDSDRLLRLHHPLFQSKKPVLRGNPRKSARPKGASKNLRKAA